MDTHDQDINDLGLAADLEMMKRSPRDRRRILKMGAIGIGMLLTGGGALVARASAGTSSYLPMVIGAGSTPITEPTATTPTTTPAVCVSEIPQETAGPYPADGSNQNLNALTLSGIVRSDIRTSLGTKNVAAGVPTTVILTLVDTNNSCAPLVDYAVYLWHCNRDGKYSMYTNGVTNEDYLRGVQPSASDGTVTFTTVFPACYSGRWPHIHFEIYPSLAKATSASNLVHTSQLALPEDVCNTVYATSGYSASVQNLSQTSLSKDNVFGDGSSLQVATVTGDVTNGYVARLTVGVAV